MLFFSAKASSFGGLSNIGSIKNVTVSGFDQNALLNLITGRNSELMAESQFPQTTRSLLKTGLLLIYYITFLFLFLFSINIIISSKIDQPLTPSFP